MTRLLSVVGLAWLYCTIGELQPIEYLKCVFLEILNVTTWSVFQNKVTNKHQYKVLKVYMQQLCKYRVKTCILNIERKLASYSYYNYELQLLLNYSALDFF